MKAFLVIIEQAGTNCSAYVPDLPGCVATGATADEAETHLRQAMELYVEALREDGHEVPAPTTHAREIKVAW